MLLFSSLKSSFLCLPLSLPQGPCPDGLVHLSQLSDKFIKHPMEVVAVGDIVKVRVIEIDKARERVSLSMRELAPIVTPVI